MEGEGRRERPVTCMRACTYHACVHARIMHACMQYLHGQQVDGGKARGGGEPSRERVAMPKEDVSHLSRWIGR